LLMSVIILFWTSFLIRTYAWIGILQERGLLDLTVMALGLSEAPLGVLFTRTAVIIGFVHVFLPLMLLPIYAAVRNLDPNLLLAAQDLGAPPARTFLRVTLPLTMTGVLTGILLFFTPTFGAFVTPLLLGSTESIMIGNVIETQFGEAFNWPYGSALSCIVVVTVVVLLVLFNRYVAFDDLYRNR
ncbi:MAG: ABC transporter permease, partial [Gammaproteobacteria bacterium]|nr:ABC transporter permease [Gammaproteobacteria bacterium]